MRVNLIIVRFIKMKRMIKTVLIISLLSVSSIGLMLFPEKVLEELFGWPKHFDTILMLILPSIPFLIIGWFAEKIYKEKYLVSVVVSAVTANVLLHYLGCIWIWIRGPHPGLILDSVIVEVVYHIGLIASCLMMIKIRNLTNRSRESGNSLRPSQISDI